MIKTARAMALLCSLGIIEGLPQPAAAQSAAFECDAISDRGVRTGPPITSFDFGNVYTGERGEDRYGTFFVGEVRWAGFSCSNVQLTPVAFTGLDVLSSSGDSEALHVWGYCINRQCVDGTNPRTIPPRGRVEIPMAFIPSTPGLYSRTFTVQNGNGLAPTTLTVSGNAITPAPIPTLGPEGLALFGAAVALLGVATLLRR